MYVYIFIPRDFIRRKSNPFRASDLCVHIRRVVKKKKKKINKKKCTHTTCLSLAACMLVRILYTTVGVRFRKKGTEK
jgi:hypothetical protein